MRRTLLAVAGTIGLFGLYGVVAYGQQAGQGRGGAPAPQVPNLSTDKTMFWTSSRRVR